MNKYSLVHLSDTVLIRDLKAMLIREREATAMLLAHIAEVDARRLYAPAGYSSMFAYCVEELRLSEDAAGRRIHAARAARRFPVLFDAVADGHLNVTAVSLIAPHLRPENLEELMEAATHRRTADVRDLLSSRFPIAASPPVSTIRPIAQHVLKHVESGSESGVLFSQDPAAPHVIDDATRTEPARQAAVEAPEAKRFLLQVTLDEHAHDRLRYAQALLCHSVPPNDVPGLILLALETLIEKAEKRKLGAPSTARKGAARQQPPRPRTAARRRYIPTEVRRAVWERDRGQCTFVSTSGHRCLERRYLEFDHVDPLARGGKSTVEGLRLRCRAHNQLEADRAFGAEFMNGKRAQARRLDRPAGTVHPTEEDCLTNCPDGDAVAVGAPKPETDDVTQDVLAGLRGLGCRGEDARRAAQYSASLETGSLEERMRAALSFVSGRSRATRHVFQPRPSPNWPRQCGGVVQTEPSQTEPSQTEPS